VKKNYNLIGFAIANDDISFHWARHTHWKDHYFGLKGDLFIIFESSGPQTFLFSNIDYVTHTVELQPFRLGTHTWGLLNQFDVYNLIKENELLAKFTYNGIVLNPEYFTFVPLSEYENILVQYGEYYKGRREGLHEVFKEDLKIGEDEFNETRKQELIDQIKGETKKKLIEEYEGFISK
jgi:hypothetical protein